MNAVQYRDNRVLLVKLAVIVVAMFGFGYALVPFYEKICEVTGLRNIARADEVKNTQVDATRDVRIEFDSNVRKLPWQFRALTPVIGVHPGEVRQVMYEIVNTTDRPMTGQAIPSYGPAACRAVLPEARVLLLREADAATRRAAADAGRVRHRRGAAEGHRDDHAVVHVLRSRRRGQNLIQGAGAPEPHLPVHREVFRMSAAQAGTKPYYFVPQPSYWPLVGSAALLLLGMGAALWMNAVTAGPWLVAAGFCVLLVMLFGWFGTVIGESEHRLYNAKVDMSFRWSMGWFIFSEVMFFAAFFGALFYVRNLAVPDLGSPTSKLLLWPDYVAGWPTVGPVHQGTVHADGRDRDPAPQHDHPAHVGLHAHHRAPRAEAGSPRAAQAVAVRDDRAGLHVPGLPGLRVHPRLPRRSTSSSRPASTARRSSC